MLNNKWKQLSLKLVMMELEKKLSQLKILTTNQTKEYNKQTEHIIDSERVLKGEIANLYEKIENYKNLRTNAASKMIYFQIIQENML